MNDQGVLDRRLKVIYDVFYRIPHLFHDGPVPSFDVMKPNLLEFYHSKFFSDQFIDHDLTEALKLPQFWGFVPSTDDITMFFEKLKNKHGYIIRVSQSEPDTLTLEFYDLCVRTTFDEWQLELANVDKNDEENKFRRFELPFYPINYHESLVCFQRFVPHEKNIRENNSPRTRPIPITVFGPEVVPETMAYKTKYYVKWNYSKRN